MRILLVTMLLLIESLAGAENQPAWVWRLPPGMPEPYVPADNPMSEDKRALGERLFFEPKLSVTGGMACANCHEQERAFTDGRPRSPGATGELTERGAMSLVNVAYSISLGWNKVEARELEQQMLEPLFNTHPVEMGLKGRETAVAALLASRADYRRQFRRAFPGEPQPVTMPNIIKAIACYLRSVIKADSPFDRLLYRGVHMALSLAARRGMDVFFSDTAGCAKCHSGVNFAGPWRDATGATGQATLANNGLGMFKVPTLRNVALTAPYMHDGRFATLANVITHYSELASSDPQRDSRLPRRPLTQSQQQDLQAFLHALTDNDMAFAPVRLK